MERNVSIAIETSCRTGGAALGIGGELARTVAFDAASRHATVLITQLKGLLDAAELCATDLREVYVSAGPGSFTGLRIGITVARTLAQAVPAVRCVAVPTVAAVADSARPLNWAHLGVVLDAKDDLVYAATFARRDEQIVPCSPPAVVSESDFLAAAPRPITLIGEGLAYHDLAGPDVTIPPPASPLHLPTAEGVWRVGREMARRGEFTEYHRLGPTYTRKPEAVRLWERRGGNATS